VIGQLLDGRYYITQALATGGFSQTYLAEDSRIPGRPLCVVKQLKLQTNDPHVLATMQRLFNTEAEILAKLGEHDRIPRLLAHFQENQEFYLVQEYIVGHPLLIELKAGTPWQEAEIRTLLTDVLQTLSFVHEHGVIHRDIKPANMIRRGVDRKLVLIDFGAVKERTTTLISTEAGNPSVVIGTPVYMPIEQLRGYPQFNSDLYSLGAIAIQAASGLSVSELQSALDPSYPSSTVQWRNQVQVSPQLAEILARMVQPDYHQRYQSTNEVLKDLQSAATVLDQSREPATIPVTKSAESLQTVIDPAPPPDFVSQPVSKRRWLDNPLVFMGMLGLGLGALTLVVVSMGGFARIVARRLRSIPPVTSMTSPVPSSKKFVVKDTIACRSIPYSPCEAEAQGNVFDRDTPISVTAWFQNDIKTYTPYSVRLQYTPIEGNPKDVPIKTGRFRAPNKHFTFTLQRPSGGWSPGYYRFVMRTNDGTTIQKRFSIQ
jgi:eukaryotic-like serine/threonine-protein kinase